MTEEIYRLEQDDKTYIVTWKVINNHNLRFTCQCENDPSYPDLYANEIDLSNLQSMKSFFKAFNSIQEVQNNLLMALDPSNPQIGIDMEGNNCEFIFYTQTGTDDDFARIPLYPQKQTQYISPVVDYQPMSEENYGNSEIENEIRDLSLRNNEIEKEIADLRRQIKSQKLLAEQEKNQRLENERQLLLQQSQQIRQEQQNQQYQQIPQHFQQKQRTPNKTTLRNVSNPQQGKECRIVKGEIIRNPPELELISKQINSRGKNICYDLLYKASSDGGSAETFHSKCDKARATLVLVETTEGRRFGGYTSENWRGDGEDKIDDNAFIFSLDKMMTYSVHSGEPAIGCYEDYGPVFMGCQIRIYDDCFINGGSTYERDLNYYTTEDFELNGGEQNFSVKDIEVYKVTFA